MADRVDEIVVWYENLTIDKLDELSKLYVSEVSFKDPIHELHNIEELKKYFLKLYLNLRYPRFVFNDRFVKDHKVVLFWDFDFDFFGKSMKIKGCSKLEIDDRGLIKIHRDYWDLAEDVYEKIPGLGLPFRFFKSLFG